MTINYGLLLVGVIFLIGGIALTTKEKQNKKCNTAAATAEVVQYITEIHHSAGDCEGSYCYYPVLRYCVDGKWYENKSDLGRGRQKYTLGEKVNILYDPQDPDSFSIAGDHAPMIVSMICLLIGIAICILAFVAD